MEFHALDHAADEHDAGLQIGTPRERVHGAPVVAPGRIIGFQNAVGFPHSLDDFVRCLSQHLFLEKPSEHRGRAFGPGAGQSGIRRTLGGVGLGLLRLLARPLTSEEVQGRSAKDHGEKQQRQPAQDHGGHGDTADPGGFAPVIDLVLVTHGAHPQKGLVLSQFDFLTGA